MLTLNTFKFISKLHHSKRNVSKSNELSLKMINLYYLLMPNYIYILKCSFMSSNHYQPWFFFTVQRFARTRSSVNTQCVRCVTRSVPTGICPTVVLTHESPTFLTTLPPLLLPLSWHYGVRQIMNMVMYTLCVLQQETYSIRFLFSF